MTVDKLRGYEPFFDEWSVEGKIAEGRHSKVFKAVRTVDGQTEYQCLKTVKFPSGDEELSQVISSGLYENVQQYLDEVELSVRQSMDKMLTLRENKNIVRFDNYTIRKESSCFYLVILMELLSPMNEYLKTEAITQNDVIDLGCDMCLAIEGFRQAGILHREIKPENIYIDEAGNYKLGDFGVCSSRFGEDKIVSSYIAPELYKEAEEDISSDIYSLGIVLYKLINDNRLPFLPSYPAPVSIEDRESAFTKRMRGDLFPAPSNATSQLANVIYKAAAYNVNERFCDPAALFDALEANYIPDEPEMDATAIFNPPVEPVNPYHITDDTGIPLYEQNPVMHNDVTEEEKEDFAEIFTEDDEEEEEEGERVDKKWYIIIIALVAVLAVIIGLIAKSSINSKKETTTTTTVADVTFGEQTLATTTTTVPTTTETTTTATTTTATTTTATTTTETTTTATTTTETTTETTTTATTTTESTTTATTTTETTTEFTTEATTESTTEATEPEYTEPVLVYSPNVEGGKDTRGREYKEVDLTVEESFNDANEVMLAVAGLEGEDAESNENYITVCVMDNSRMVKRSTATIFIETESEDLITLRITADDDDFTFEPDKYQYFICLEDGAIGTSSTTNLGTQIRVE